LDNKEAVVTSIGNINRLAQAGGKGGELKRNRCRLFSCCQRRGGIQHPQRNPRACEQNYKEQQKEGKGGNWSAAPR
jgi:hypothetical protein